MNSYIDEPVRGFSSSNIDAMRYSSSEISPYENVGLMLKSIKNGDKILDIGCGSGSISNVIKNARTTEIIGVEPNTQRAMAAEKSGLFVVNDIYSEEIGREHGPFDVVLFADVLEHLVDPASMLEQVKPALAENGRVIASVPNVAHWTIRLALLFGRFDYQASGLMDATHLRWFTRDGITKLFDAAGYEIDKLDESAGSWMSGYRWTPVRLLPFGWRSKVVYGLCQIAPGFFGYQHIVTARPKSK
jgi:2-polyprenyl-3-methyl-5-hydroxy-6-metoxy-1,4-benzoquinol methylase